MSAPTEPSPNSIPAEGPDSSYLHREVRLANGKCLANRKCPESPPHPRKWVSCPNGSERKGRTLVLCFDGTGDSLGDSNTNFAQFMAMLKKDDPTKQLVYYQLVTGTYTGNMNKTPVIEAVTRLGDKMFAHNLSGRIKAGYKFLMQYYQSGDKICIFGFSRGTYTARALAGMVHKVGLLPQSDFQQLGLAYRMYKKRGAKNLKQSRKFKQAYCIDVRVEFLGVWDTVGSVGRDLEDLPFCGSDSAIAHFRHAVALDERRVKFTPTYYGTKTSKDEDPGDERDRPVQKSEGAAKSLHVHATDVEEVFFAGTHCDVGGGSRKNRERYSLAHITLRWMIRECFKTKTGIIFDAHKLKYETGLDIGPGPTFEVPPPVLPTSRTPPGDRPVGPTGDEPQEELNDALSPIYDQLEEHSCWRIMELIPMFGSYHTGSEGSNLGKGRTVESGIKVHRSVKTRILAGVVDGNGVPYLPQIRITINGKAGRLERERWLEAEPEHFEWVD